MSAFFSLAVIICSAAVLVVLALFANPYTANSWTWTPPQIVPLGFTPTALTGYAWSDNIGWISLNCSTDPGGCSTPAGNWGISISPAGVLSGYAWSENIGWISANSSDLAGCPLSSQGCTATLSGNFLTGSLRALSADNNGWDGWIRLNNENVTNGYMVYYSGGGFKPCTVGGSCAWGSDVVGWVDFSMAHLACTPGTSYSCTGTNNLTITKTDVGASCGITTTTIATCVDPGYCLANTSTCQYPLPNVVFSVTPNLVNKGNSAKVTWNASAGVTSCQVSNDADSLVWTGLTNGASPKITNPISKTTIFTLSCVRDDPTNPTPYSETETVGTVPTYHEN